MNNILMIFYNCIKIIAQLVHKISLTFCADLGQKVEMKNYILIENYEININSVCSVYIVYS